MTSKNTRIGVVRLRFMMAFVQSGVGGWIAGWTRVYTLGQQGRDYAEITTTDQEEADTKNERGGETRTSPLA
jgi:hypothetical protein